MDNTSNLLDPTVKIETREGRRTRNNNDDDKDLRFGWSKSCTPKCLQFLANRKAFLIIFSTTCILQGTFHTYFVAVITTLEKLFSIPSKTTGSLMAATEIGQVGSALLLPYYAGQGHRPRWMGVGAALFSLAALLCASPHILIPPTNVIENQQDEYCVPGANITCEDSQTIGGPPYLLFAILFLSLLTVGLGQTAVYTLGMPYLDDNVASRDSPLYFSITIGVRILGPVTGFILGALCTRIYIYPTETPPPDLNPSSKGWLGAWWLGMVLISVLLFLTSIVIYAFPRKLTKKATTKGKPTLKNFPQTFKRLINNKILLLRTFSSVFHLFPISGLYTFLPKYLESQFHMAAYESNMVTGIAGILVMGIGIFFSGILIRKYGPTGRTVAAWVAACAAIYAIGMFVLMGIGCDDAQPVLNSTYGCNTTCSCTGANFSPVCGKNEFGKEGINFYSPCHAGCPNKSLKDCSCADKVDRGFCDLDCRAFSLYLAIFMVIVLVHSTSEVGSMLLTLRCVEPRDKAMALGFIQFAIGLFGNVPCSVIYGAIVDSTCLIWGEDCSGRRGHCELYDSHRFRTLFHGTTGALMLVAFAIDLTVFFHAREIKLETDTELQPI